ncbi:MAG TPA: ABC transporter ATP-binding protein [Xanthobacteraceae bacterium]|nr:ABC transporter ATP-binding protein [Xanthobacteraceae bacterium]
MTPLCVVEGLRVRYAGALSAALDGVDLTLRPGAPLAVIGESGSGKSTLALALAGLLPGDAQTEGRLLWPAGALRPGRDIGLVFQDPWSSLDPVLSIGHQIGEVLAAHLGLKGAAARARAQELLARVQLDSGLLQAYPHQLSGGQRQRAALALAIAARPRLLIADEPTSALDAVVQAAILALIAELCAAQGMALLFVTHDIALAAGLAAHILVLKDGRTVESGPARAVLRAPKADYTRRLIAAHLGLDTPGPSRPAAPRPLLCATGLHKRYRRGGEPVAALDGVSIELAAGETLALAGASGSGKSTLCRVLLRLTEPDAGTLHLGGLDLRALRGRALRAARPRVQMVFQDPLAAFNPRATVGRVLADPLRVNALVPARAIPAAVAGLLAEVGLPAALAARPVRAISGGQRQRVAIARALATGPELIVLDEPVSALDTLVRAEILALLAALQQRRNVAYLLVTHDLGVARALAHRLAVMDRGRIVEEGPVESVLAAPQSVAARALIAAVPDLRAVSKL